MCVSGSTGTNVAFLTADQHQQLMSEIASELIKQPFHFNVCLNASKFKALIYRICAVWREKVSLRWAHRTHLGMWAEDGMPPGSRPGPLSSEVHLRPLTWGHPRPCKVDSEDFYTSQAWTESLLKVEIRTPVPRLAQMWIWMLLLDFC